MKKILFALMILPVAALAAGIGVVFDPNSIVSFQPSVTTLQIVEQQWGKASGMKSEENGVIVAQWRYSQVDLLNGVNAARVSIRFDKDGLMQKIVEHRHITDANRKEFDRSALGGFQPGITTASDVESKWGKPYWVIYQDDGAINARWLHLRSKKNASRVEIKFDQTGKMLAVVENSDLASEI
ncbi:MAG: hypothetical protein IV101_09365 [Dechloromonas sp.]|uniref:hypothetical protein n=1 Tax=Dechloromonas sp. TaxID=1917218 RepID=UPI0027FEE135|nr:hypothetical protein [Dechloromonas sp.]MBT9521094.1 hypothetical protein [Dechloromonas sp.]